MADENVGVSPPNFTTVAGRVRLLTGDTTPRDLETPTPGLGQYAWFSDDELEAYGTEFGGNAKRVAVYVLSQVAMSQALLLKKWTSEDLQVDGPAILRAMEGTLKRLSAEADKDDALLGEEEFFGVYGGDGGRYRILLPHGYPWWLND